MDGMGGMGGMGGWPQPKSGLRKAAEVLLAVGAGLQAFLAVLMVLVSLVLHAAFARLGPSSSELPGWLLGFYLVWGALSAVGCVFGFVAFGKARQGKLNAAFALGLVGALLPPFNVVALLGAIFCKVCPEGQQAPAPAPR